MTAPQFRHSSGRFYTHPTTGERLPGITTVTSVLAKPMLISAAAKECANYADENWQKLADLTSDERITLIKRSYNAKWEKKRDLGTEVHEAVEAWCTGRDMPEWAPDVAPFMDEFVNFLQARQPEFIENEATVYSEKHGYAGTFDILARINGWLTLIDVKTGKDVYDDAALQLAALANADSILRADGSETPLPRPERAAVLHLRPRSWYLVAVNLDGCFEGFLGALALHRWQRQVAPNCLGARLTEVANG